METRCKVPTRLFLTLAFWLLPFQASAQAPANCAPGKVMCGTQCVNLSINARNCGACGAVCGAGRTCSAGVCIASGAGSGAAKVNSAGNGNATCAAGKVMCGTQCVNLSINARNCGACGAVCGAGRTCSAGKCSR